MTLVTPNLAVDGGVAAHVSASRTALISAGWEVVVAAEDGDFPFDPSARHDQLVENLKRTEPDVVHFHNVYDAELTRRAGTFARTVVSAHGWPGCGPNTYWFPSGRACARPHGLGCLGGIVALGCSHRRNRLAAVSTLAIARRRLAAHRASNVSVAYSSAVVRHLAVNGIEARLVPLPADIADHPPAPASMVQPEVDILFVGRLGPEKGVEALLHAASSVNASIQIVGDGYIRPQLEALAQELGLSAHFTGWLDSHAVQDAYRATRMVVMPSMWPEPFGLAALEGAANNRLVIASDRGGVTDWITDGVNGLLVPAGNVGALADAIRKVLEDPGNADRLSAEAFRTAQVRFSAAAHIAALTSAYA